MKNSKNILICSVGAALSIGLIVGCGGGSGGSKGTTIDDGAIALCADGTYAQQATLEKAEAFCRAYRGGVAPTPTPKPR